MPAPRASRRTLPFWSPGSESFASSGIDARGDERATPRLLSLGFLEVLNVRRNALCWGTKNVFEASKVQRKTLYYSGIVVGLCQCCQCRSISRCRCQYLCRDLSVSVMVLVLVLSVSVLLLVVLGLGLVLVSEWMEKR